MALRDPRQSSAEAARELEAAASVVEENIRRADERGAVDPAEGFAPSLGVGLASCGGCGRIIALDALAKHRAGNCARVRQLAGLESIAGALGAPHGAPHGAPLGAAHGAARAPPAAVENATPSPKKKAKTAAKKLTKKAQREAAATAAGLGLGMGAGAGVDFDAGGRVVGFPAGGLAAQIAPDLPPHLVGANATPNPNAVAKTKTKTKTKTTAGTAGLVAEGPVAGADGTGTGAAAKRKRKTAAGSSSGAASNRGKKAAAATAAAAAAAAAAAGGGHFAGGMHAPYAGAHLSYGPPGYFSGVSGAPPGYAPVAGAGAVHGGFSAAAMMRRLQKQRHARDAAIAPAGAVAPLASPADPRKFRELRQRALYAMMFHESQDALVASVKPHVVAAGVYLAGAQETVAPWPKQLSS